VHPTGSSVDGQVSERYTLTLEADRRLRIIHAGEVPTDVAEIVILLKGPEGETGTMFVGFEDPDSSAGRLSMGTLITADST
jgi:hypothetical protein